MNTESPYVIPGDRAVYKNIETALSAILELKSRIIVIETPPRITRKGKFSFDSECYFGVNTDGLVNEPESVSRNLHIIVDVFAWLMSLYDHADAAGRKQMCEQLRAGLTDEYQAEFKREAERRIAQAAGICGPDDDGPLALRHFENTRLDGSHQRWSRDNVEGMT